MNMWLYFISGYSLCFHLLTKAFLRANVFNLIRSSLSILLLLTMLLVSNLRTLCPVLDPEDFFLMLFLKDLWFYILYLSSLKHWKYFLMKLVGVGKHDRQRKESICMKRKKQHGIFKEEGKILIDECNIKRNHRAKANIRKGTLYEFVLFGFYQVIDRDPLKDFKQEDNVFRFLFWKGHFDISVENGFQPGLFIFYSFPGEKCYNKIEWFRDQ